jgi:L-2-hydroxyglutarate oxidase LhgO
VETTDCLVVGAGVIGLAVARALARAGREVVVAEKERWIGSETSSRNSEVIHAGIYYPAGSLKARFCVEGRNRLYAYCESRGVPHRRLGKLIVATSTEEATRLDQIKAHAEANGVLDLRRLAQDEVAAMEPALNGVAALLSPSTGIIDSHAFMASLQGEAEAAGAALALGTPFISGELGEDGVVCRLGPDAFQLKARLVVNAAGLAAHRVAASISGVRRDDVPTVALAKGNYFGCAVRPPFERLVYPVPERGGLGVHLTFDMGGKGRFGPDVEWIDSVNYEVDARRAEPFYDAVRRYWPGLPDGALYPDYAGIRVKLNGEASPDFLVATQYAPSLINLFGFESPGLTSALAIGDYVLGEAARAARLN